MKTSVRRSRFGKENIFYESKKRFHGKKPVTPATCALFVEIKPIWILWRYLGFSPHSENKKTGDVTCKLFSISMAHALLWYCFLTYVSIVVILSIREEIFKTTDFPSKVVHYLNCLSSSTLLVTPVTFWLDARALPKYLQKWVAFEENYNKSFGTSLKFNLRRRCYFLMAIVVSIAVVPNLLALTWSVGILKVFMRINLSLSVSLLLPHLFLNDAMIATATHSVRKKLEQDFSNLENCRKLWYQLRKLIHETGPFSNVNMYMMPHLTASLIMSTFAYLSRIFDERSPPRLLFFVIVCLAFIVCLTELGEALRRVFTEFSSSFHRNRRPLKSYDRLTQENIKICSKMLRSAPVNISQHGFWGVSYKSFVSWSSFVLTYVLILFQLQLQRVGTRSTKIQPLNLTTIIPSLR